MVANELELENTPANDAAAGEITDDMLEQATIEVADPTRDINIPSFPPPAGVYPLRWKRNSNKGGSGQGIQVKSNSQNQLTLNLWILGFVQADGEEFHDYVVSDYMNTFIRRGTTDVHHFLNCLGSPLSVTTNLLVVKNTLIEVLDLEPTSHAMIEWKASIQESPNKWKTLANKMTDFPKNTDGTYQPWIDLQENAEGEAVRVYATGYIAAHVLPDVSQ